MIPLRTVRSHRRRHQPPTSRPPARPGGLFNFRWSRRVLGQGAIVLLITDGLDRDDAGELDAEAGRLARSCRELIWLNPLLRYAAFQPKAAGIRALLPHVNRFLPLYNIATLADLATELARAVRRPHLTQRRSA